MQGGRTNSSHAGVRTAAAIVALSVGAFAGPVTLAHANTTLPQLLVKKRKKRKKKNAMTPEKAADLRMPVQDQGRQMVEAGEMTAATILFDGAAQTQGDPILFLDAGDAHLAIGTEERDIAAAQTAKMRAQTAQDILYFHLDSNSDPDYRQVTNDEVSGLLARAGQMIDDADALIAEIEAEQEALANPDPGPSRKKGNGRGMRLAGFGLTGLGVAGLGVGAAGLVIGRVNQSRVEDPAVYGTEFDDYDTRGRRGNLIAGVGLAVGGVALAAGVTLIILGKRRGAKAGDEPSDDSLDAEPEDDFSMAIVPTGRGLALTGRF